MSDAENPVHQAEHLCLVKLGYICDAAWYPRGHRAKQNHPLHYYIGILLTP